MANENFYQKNGLAIMMMARDLLSLEEGGRLIPISEYAEQLSVSRWTIQTALKFFGENQCIQLEKRGTLGTFVYHIDRQKLWNYSGWDPLHGLAPLPTSVILDGLLTGLSESFRLDTAPVILSFMVSSKKRFDSLMRNHCQFVISTKLAAKIYGKEYPQAKIALELTNSSYCMPFEVYTFNPEIKEITDGMNIAVYENALEQCYLVKQLCKDKKVNLIYAAYHDQMSLIKSGKVDAIIQRGDDDLKGMPEKKYKIPLTYLGLDEEMVTPVVVINSEEYGLERVIQKMFHTGVIAKEQKEVISGKKYPRYF